MKTHWQEGYITFEEYVEVLDDGATAPKAKLGEILQKREIAKTAADGLSDAAGRITAGPGLQQTGLQQSGPTANAAINTEFRRNGNKWSAKCPVEARILKVEKTEQAGGVAQIITYPVAQSVKKNGQSQPPAKKAQCRLCFF